MTTVAQKRKQLVERVEKIIRERGHAGNLFDAPGQTLRPLTSGQIATLREGLEAGLHIPHDLRVLIDPTLGIEPNPQVPKDDDAGPPF